MGWGIGIGIGWPNNTFGSEPAPILRTGYFQITLICGGEPPFNTFTELQTNVSYQTGDYVYCPPLLSRVQLGVLSPIEFPGATFLAVEGPVFNGCAI